MMYSFNYKRGTQVFDNVKSLADAINFELPRNWDCSGEMNRKADEINAFMQNKVAFAHLGVVGLFDSYTPHMSTTMLEAQADEALRQVCRAFEELGADMIGAVLKMLETIRNDAEQDSYVDEFLNFNDYEFEVDEDGCFVGVH